MNKLSSFPAIIGFETNNQYEIKNSLGQQIFHAKENTDCCTRNICGPLRSFDLQITDNFDQEVIHLIRPYRCTSCCFPCCLQEVITKVLCSVFMTFGDRKEYITTKQICSTKCCLCKMYYIYITPFSNSFSCVDVTD